MKSILDKSFAYTPSASTDLKKTFARIRREIREQKAREANEPMATVSPLPQRKRMP